MKKDNKTLDELVTNLSALGYEIDPYYSSDGMALARGPKFLIRAFDKHNGNIIQIGMLETFDKWSNSVDYEDRLPETAKGLSQVFEAVSLLNKCHYCPRWDTPHLIANKHCCDGCYKTKNHNRKKDGKR
jgi:hypothetical protein